MAVRDDEFDELFRTTFPLALAAVSRIVSPRAAAEDVAAEAFARAYARWPEVRVLPWREAWVMRVALNLAIDLTRRRPLRLWPAPAVAFDDRSADQLALAAEVRRLPRRQREVVALRYLADLDEATVAQVLGISAGSVKTHLHRGLAQLRSAMQDPAAPAPGSPGHDGAGAHHPEPRRPS